MARPLREVTQALKRHLACSTVRVVAIGSPPEAPPELSRGLTARLTCAHAWSGYRNRIRMASSQGGPVVDARGRRCPQPVGAAESEAAAPRSWPREVSTLSVAWACCSPTSSSVTSGSGSVTSLSESAWAIPVQAAGRRIPVGGDLLGGVDRARLLRDPDERVEDRGSSPRRPD